MPRLSVLMPVLNGEAYLQVALRSLLGSLPTDAEVLAMDDGSNDNSQAILAEAAEMDPRLRITRHEVPAGVSASLNELAALADCIYLARMDADDIVLPQRWRLTERALVRADLAFTSVLFIDGRGRLRGVDQPGHFSSAAVPYHLLFGCCLVHPTLMMRRDVFDSLGGYADTRAEDYELWMRAAVAGYRIVRTATPGLRYRRHEDQVTVQRPWVEENPNSPLYHSYVALLESTLGRRPDDWEEVFSAALTHSRVDCMLGARIQAVHRDVIAAAAGLPPVDLALLRWRAAREARRTRSRMISPAGVGRRRASPR